MTPEIARLHFNQSSLRCHNECPSHRPRWAIEHSTAHPQSLGRKTGGEPLKIRPETGIAGQLFNDTRVAAEPFLTSPYIRRYEW